MDSPLKYNRVMGENNINTGALQEIPEICIDRFLERDLTSAHFFLTHYHTDHTDGLNQAYFEKRLLEPGVKLYLTEETLQILQKFYRIYLGELFLHLEDLLNDGKIQLVYFHQPIFININKEGGSMSVKVTPIPAYHCVGSAMFLFETPELTILYTGDFRLTADELKSIPALHFQGLPIKIHRVYADTTFSNVSATSLPTRDEALLEFISWAREHLQDPNTLLKLEFASKTPYFEMFPKLEQGLGQRIYMNEDLFRFCRDIDIKDIPELKNTVTKFIYSTQTFIDQEGIVYNPQKYKIIRARFSAAFYATSESEEGNERKIKSDAQGDYFPFCYSTHASVKELAGVIDYLKPERVTPLAMPFGNKSTSSQIKGSLESQTEHKFIFEDFHHIGLLQEALRTAGTAQENSFAIHRRAEVKRLFDGGMLPPPVETKQPLGRRWN